MAGLAGCAQLRKAPVAPAGSPESFYALKNWRLEGRIGVRTPDDAWQARLFWEHAGEQDRLRVAGPLSQGMVSIIVQKDLIYINEGNGVTELSREPEFLLKERLGFVVPLHSLRYWILGTPDPRLAYTMLPEEEGGGQGFQQAGWLIRREEGMAVGSHLLPRKLRVEGGGVKLKIIADQWNIEG
jgi:outer membrane lipoprotein LolB